MLDVSDISSLHAMLCHYPELISYMSIADWRAPWLPRLSSSRFEQRISWQRQPDCKREPDRRIEDVLLKRVNDLMLHFVNTLRF
jgi:hypothetical protein